MHTTRLFYLCIFAILSCGHAECENLVVDLGYARHAPSWANSTTQGATLLNYNNIRYAQAPAGETRFRKPIVPPPTSGGISFGNLTASEDDFLPPGSTPPSSFPSSWQTDCLSAAPFGNPFPLLNGTTWGSEDCLFLNVIKPASARAGDKLPVLHWVVGSAFAFGGKDWTGFGVNTYGLFNKPYNLPDDFIMVTHNYRLGIPGWTPKLDEDMNGNLGAWDTLAALEWTRKYIDRFGGDPERITVIGQSAGASIIAWLLLANNGTLDLPFDQAWIASPSIVPRGDIQRSRPVWDAILNATGCDSLICMRNVSTEAMMEANAEIFIRTPPGPGGGSLGPDVGFSLTVDGELLSDLPVNLLKRGIVNSRIQGLIVGNTEAEGLGLSSDRGMPGRFPEVVRSHIPKASDEDVRSLLELYQFPSGMPETLAWHFTTDLVWSCNVANIAKAYSGRARRQLFNIPPSLHGLDLAFYFYDSRAVALQTQTEVELALATQVILLQFLYRKEFQLPKYAPFARSLSEWPVYATRHIYANLTISGFSFEPVADILSRRCGYIDSLIQNPRNGV